MTFTRLSNVKRTTDVVSGILNWICPECGGRMGGRGTEFNCQGQCQPDWRGVWECLSASWLTNLQGCKRDRNRLVAGRRGSACLTGLHSNYGHPNDWLTGAHTR